MTKLSILTPSKSSEKTPVATHTNVKKTVSPHGYTEDEVIALKAQNMALKDALIAVKKAAEAQENKCKELVWYAKYRTRFPTKTASKRIENERREDVSKLKGIDGDFHHGFNSAMLAASRLFKEYASVPNLDDNFSDDEVDNLMSSHAERINQSVESFPNFYISPQQVEAEE